MVAFDGAVLVPEDQCLLARPVVGGESFTLGVGDRRALTLVGEETGEGVRWSLGEDLVVGVEEPSHRGRDLDVLRAVVACEEREEFDMARGGDLVDKVRLHQVSGGTVGQLIKDSLEK